MKTNQYIAILGLLLERSVVANFEFWSEFILRLQRDEAQKHPALQELFGSSRIPSLFCLRLRGAWRMGDEQRWESSVSEFAIKGQFPIPLEAPLQAALLVSKLGCSISAIKVSDNSDLILHLSDGCTLTIQGGGGRWEESWFLELPADDPDREQWSIICDAEGNIAGKIPLPGLNSQRNPGEPEQLK